MSPRKNENSDSASGASLTSPRGSILGSISKILWSPAGDQTPGRAPEAGSPEMMTQATPRSPRTPGMRPPLSTEAASSSVAAPGDASGTSQGGDKRGLLDTLFSPVFTLFASSKPDAPAAMPVPPPAPPPPRPAPALAPSQSDEDDLDEFDPYTFIRSLPPTAPAAALARPVCLPKKTRGTHAVSLILDLDETLLHSSIVPLPSA